MKRVLFFCLFLLFIYAGQTVWAYEEETLIIFDSSVSMLNPLSGKPKYIIAVDEAKKVLESVNPSKKIGLRIIGLTLDSSLAAYMQNPSELCKATSLKAPVKSGNVEYIKKSLDDIFPLGTTPLIYTLDTAINYDFSRSAYLKHIILITDGAESCSGNPCEYIRELMRTRDDIKIDIIAIRVNAEDFKHLKCLSDYTHGSIFDVTRPKDIEEAFVKFLNPYFAADIKAKFNDIKTGSENIIYKNYVFDTYE